MIFYLNKLLKRGGAPVFFLFSKNSRESRTFSVCLWGGKGFIVRLPRWIAGCSFFFFVFYHCVEEEFGS